MPFCQLRKAAPGQWRRERCHRSLRQSTRRLSAVDRSCSFAEQGRCSRTSRRVCRTLADSAPPPVHAHVQWALRRQANGRAQWRTTSSHELARASKGRRSAESACLQRHIVGRRASAVIIQRTWTPQHLNRPAHTSFVSHMDTSIVPFLCCTSPKSRSTKHTPASTGRRVRSILTLQLAPA